LEVIIQNKPIEMFKNDYGIKINTMFSEFEFLEKFNKILLKCV